MVFILLIRSLDQLSRPGWAATQVCISGAGPSGLFPPDSWLGHPALGQTGLPPLRGLGAFHKTRAGLWHQAGLSCGACTLWNFKSYAGSVSGLGRSPGEGNVNPLQYSCLENPMDRGAWMATVHRVAKSLIRLKWLSSISRAHKPIPWILTYWDKNSFMRLVSYWVWRWNSLKK